jgi:predicted nucleotide-binding protein (sugar kinase/HSP70/actin superfamily)
METIYEDGIPHGLLYLKYNAVIESFLQELGAEIVVSPDTNKSILDEGVRCCLDDTCLPMKFSTAMCHG